MNGDIFLKIAEKDNWNNVGIFLQLCKASKRAILRKENLKRIIDEIISHNQETKEKEKENKMEFPLWTVTSLKIEEEIKDLLPERLLNLKNIVIERLGDKLDLIKHDNFFITGGFIASCIFSTKDAYIERFESPHKSYSDIDVWCQYSEKNKERVKTQFFDYVPSFDVTKSICDFDLSCCQVGVLFENRKVKDVYFTPLFLYTLWYKTMIVRILPISLGYSIPSRVNDRRRAWNSRDDIFLTMEEIYNKHIQYCGKPESIRLYSEEEYLQYCKENNKEFKNENEYRECHFHECLQCKAYIKSRIEENYGTMTHTGIDTRFKYHGNDFCARWLERLNKYYNRLQFPMKYVTFKGKSLPLYCYKEGIYLPLRST